MTETQNVEWKRMWKDEYLAWICGFANAQGGKLDLGKNDNGQIVGLKNSKKLLEDIPNKIRDAMGIIVNINLHSVYEDRLYIANCGRLPENWTLEKLMGKHASAPFNPNIANVFYLAGFIESWGRGVEKICSACKEDGIP